MSLSRKVYKRIISIAIVLILLGSIAAYFIYNPKKAITFVFPDLDRIRYINAVIRKDSVYTTTSLVLENKNPYKLSIDTLAFTISLNDTVLADQVLSLQLHQKSFSLDTVKLPLNLNIKKIRNTIKGLQDQDSATLNAKGFAIYETIFGRVKLDFNTDKRIAVPIPPKLEVLKIERDHFNLKDKTLSAEAWIRIINEGKNLDLNLSELEYEISVKNVLHSAGKIPQSVKIKPGSSVVVKIPMKIEIFHPLKTVWKIAMDNDRLPYRLHLVGRIKENISDDGFSAPAEIWATGMLELKK